MKLLICTQAVDSTDSNLGFFTRWIEEFAKDCEEVVVICLREGGHDLPKNVRVYSLGKERSVRTRVAYALSFIRLVWRIRRNYDAVFVHMNPEYLVLAGPLWRTLGKPSALWYAHESVTPLLRIATFFADHVFTVSLESFRLLMDKKCVVGHGIDTERFVVHVPKTDSVLRLVTIGRISRRKHLEYVLPILDELARQGTPFVFTFVGAPLTTDDRIYEVELKSEIAKRPYRDTVRFSGSKNHRELPEVLAENDVMLNLSATGNMDKAGLEALAAGIPLVTTNTAFHALPSRAGLSVLANHPKELADAVQVARGADTSQISAYVREHHSLARLIPRIVEILRRT